MSSRAMKVSGSGEILMRESLGEIRMPTGFPSHFLEESEAENVQHNNG
jgi:hypothetical protein